MHTIITTLRKSAAALAALALVLVGSGAAFGAATLAHADSAPPITVTIDKFIDGAMATDASANNSAFQMTESYTIGGTPGVSNYTLSPTGINSSTPYEAVTSPLDASSTYSTSEIADGSVVGASCSDGAPFVLAGYTTGDTFAAAEAATPTMTPPSFTNLANDEYVIVWNTTCAATTTNPTTVAATGITVSDATLNGINGDTAATDSSFWVSTSTFSTATPSLPNGVYSTPDLGAQTANGAFSAQLSSVSGMPAVTPNTTYYFAAWTETNGTWSPGSILSFTTASATTTPGAPTVSGISPSTGTTTGGETVNISGTGFTGATAVDFGSKAATNFTIVNDSSITATSPARTNPGRVNVTVTTPGGVSATSTADHFDYTTSSGTISGNVGVGTLAVTSITPVQTNATADGTYADGWSYIFNITVPTDEPNLSMDFADWLNSAASSTIPVAGNMQISSAQAASTSPVTITAANQYSSPALDMTGDLAPNTPGMQVQVLVQVAVPANTVNGSYTTSYGVQTLP